jgi:hypothetical protein
MDCIKSFEQILRPDDYRICGATPKGRTPNILREIFQSVVVSGVHQPPARNSLSNSVSFIFAAI